MSNELMNECTHHDPFVIFGEFLPYEPSAFRTLQCKTEFFEKPEHTVDIVTNPRDIRVVAISETNIEGARGYTITIKIPLLSPRYFHIRHHPPRFHGPDQ